MRLAAGGMLAHYRLLEKLGEGGMGIVWKALDTTLDRPVAIKVLSARLAGDREWLERFEREAKAVAALNHPGIVTIYSVEEARGVRFLTMELVPGRPLADLIPPGGLPLYDFLHIAVPLVDAVSVMHERGIVHRDLKPANVMVAEDGRIKLLDFDLAHRGEEEWPALAAVRLPERLDRTTRLWGTLPYLSPERLRGQAIDHRADLFAVGVLLYEMLTGRRPFRGETAGDVAAAILEATPPLAAEVRPEAPLHLSRVLRQCLEKEPERRPRTAREIRSELEALRDDLDAARRARAPSVAVLPFADLSAERDQGYLCDGLAEEIIHKLARVENLRVASRSTSFRFRASALDRRGIGRELGVGAVLDGGVRRLDDRLRVTAELTDTSDGCCLWSGRFDRQLVDIFGIQEEIAESIALALEVHLSPGERRALRRTGTRDIEAYELYLRGRQYFYQFSRRNIQFALDLFRRAARRDPAFAPAHAGIADCHCYLYLYVARTEDNRARADEASRQALAVDPELAQARVSHGLALSVSGRHREAEEEFEAALRLDPQSFEAFYLFARDSFSQGNLEKAARLYERAMALRPEDYQSRLLVAQIYDDLGRGADADLVRRQGVKLAEDHLVLHPHDVRALYMAANAMVAMGEREWGLEWAERALALEPDDSMVLYNVACIRSLAGQVEEALDCLERAVAAGLVQREWIVNDSNLEPLRAHARYRALIADLERRAAAPPA